MADESFKEFVLDQLRALPDVRAGRCLARMDFIKTNISSGSWTWAGFFFKTDAQSQADMWRAAWNRFTYESKGRMLTMSYHEVPPDVLENSPELGRLGTPGNRGGRPQRQVSKNLPQNKGI